MLTCLKDRAPGLAGGARLGVKGSCDADAGRCSSPEAARPTGRGMEVGPNLLRIDAIDAACCEKEEGEERRGVVMGGVETGKS